MIAPPYSQKRVPLPRSAVSALVALLLLNACVETEVIEWAPESFGKRLIADSSGATASPKGFIGVQVEENQSDSLEALEYFPGVRVIEIVKNSPAEKSGLRKDDVILRANDLEFNTPEGFEAFVFSAEPGAHIRLEVQRHAEVSLHDVEVIETGGVLQSGDYLHHVERVKLRAEFRTGTWKSDGNSPTGTCVILALLLPRSPLNELGLKPNDALLSWNGQRIESGPDLLSRVANAELGETVNIVFVRDGVLDQEEIELWEPDSALTYLRLPILFTYKSDPPKDKTRFDFIDLFILSLFSYQRDGLETHYRILSLFGFSSGEGELAEIPLEDLQ